MKSCLLKRLASLILITTALFPGAIPSVDAQTETNNKPAEQSRLLPEDLTFRKIWNFRNLFNSKIDVETLNLKKAAASGKNAAVKKTAANGRLSLLNTRDSIETERILLGRHIPFGTYDLEVTELPQGSSVGLELYKNENNRVLLTCSNGLSDNGPDDTKELRLQVYSNGDKTIDKVIKKAKLEPPFTIKADFAAESLGDNIRRAFVSIWEEVGGHPTLLEWNIDIKTDFSNPAVVESYKALLHTRLAGKARASIAKFNNYITSGAGQADPKPLHDETGRIMRDGDTIWVAMTVRGYHMDTNYQGVYSLNIKTGELKIVSILIFNLDKRGHYSSYHAADVIYNTAKKQWLVLPTAHVERPHAIKSGIIPKDPRTTPFQFIDVTAIDYPNQGNEEDASLIYDQTAKKWRLVMCDSGKGGYQLPLLESDSWNGKFKEIARYDKAPCTGIQIQKLDGRYYVFFGRNVDNCEALRYPAMENPVKLNILSSPRSYNVWPVIIPITDETTNQTRYYLLTFDRDGHTRAHSYGNLYLYQAIEYPGMPSAEQEIPITNAEPIQNGEIRTAQQLMQIRNDLSGSYTLKNDIDLSKIDNWTPIGNAKTPFTGKFDGAGFTIKNLNIKRPNTNNVGLFGNIGQEAEVKNINISPAKIEGKIYVGALAGTNNGTIENCSAVAEVKASSAVGGLVGQNNGKISRAFSSGTVSSVNGDGIGGLVGVNCANIGEIDLDSKGIIKSSSSSSKVSGPINAGGFVGHNDCGSITDCYATGNVSGNAYVGGFIGNSGRNYDNKSSSPISNCYSLGNASGQYSVGGFIGLNDGTITQCFSAGNASGQRNIGGFIGTNTTKALIKSGYAAGKAQGNQYAAAILGWNRGSFDIIGKSDKGVSIGNSPSFSTDVPTPDLTNKSTYETGGALEAYGSGPWVITNGKYPLLPQN